MRVVAGTLIAAWFCVSVLWAVERSAAEPAPNEADRNSRVAAAEAELGDAQDEAILEATLYGQLSAQNLSDERTREMIEAARRRLERQQQRLNRTRALVAAGVAAPVSLEPEAAELDLRQKTLALATARARLFAEIVAQARAEELAASSPAQPAAGNQPAAYHFSGGVFAMAGLKSIAGAFLDKFSRALPISASGETAVHRALGFDHRGRVDVALNPDQPEGRWLCEYLESHRIAYFAFRRAVPGKATAAHIHIGPPSTRLQAAN